MEPWKLCEGGAGHRLMWLESSVIWPEMVCYFEGSNREKEEKEEKESTRDKEEICKYTYSRGICKRNLSPSNSG